MAIRPRPFCLPAARQDMEGGVNMLEIIKKFMPQNFNDTLAILLVIGVPIALSLATLPDVFAGTLGAAWLLVVQYYFRKKSTE